MLPGVAHGFKGRENHQPAVQAEPHIHNRTANRAFESNERESSKPRHQRRKHIDTPDPAMERWRLLAHGSDQRAFDKPSKVGGPYFASDFNIEFGDLNTVWIVNAAIGRDV